VILVACKTFDLNDALAAIAPAVTEDTLVLPLLNGLRHLETLDERFGKDRVLGGLCHIGVTLSDKGEVLHLNTTQHLALGPRLDSQVERCGLIHTALARGGFAAELSQHIAQSMWEKFVLLASYAAMTCLMRAPIGAIVAADEGAALMREMLTECAAVAAASGHAPDAKFMAETEAFLTEPGSDGTASMLRDIQRNARTEHENILGDMLARARSSGIATPHLRIANAHLQAYEFERVRSPVA
jgi:2-dehydropantoate 2-reductase